MNEPKEVAQKIVRQKLSVSKPQFLIGFKEKEQGASGAELMLKQAKTQILMEVLFGKSSDYFKDLYGEGLIDGTFGKDTELEKSYGFSSLGGETQDPEAVYEKTIAYLEKVKAQPLDESAVAVAKRVLLGKNLRRFNSVERLGNDFIRCFMNGFNPLEYSNIVESITISELEERLNEHFDEAACVMSVIEPLESEEK